MRLPRGLRFFFQVLTFFSTSKSFNNARLEKVFALRRSFYAQGGKTRFASAEC